MPFRIGSKGTPFSDFLDSYVYYFYWKLEVSEGAQATEDRKDGSKPSGADAHDPVRYGNVPGC